MSKEICNKAAECDAMDVCSHAHPHEPNESCKIECSHFGGECVPAGVPDIITPTDAPRPLLANETRITDPATGGQKGSKPERFDLIPAECLEKMARLYGWTTQKYEADNWRKGFSWRLSFAALMRHAWAFWRGEDNDSESGLPHLAHAAWHCFTLMWFMDNRKDKDDRPCQQTS